MEKYCIRKADLNDLEEIAELEQFCPYILSGKIVSMVNGMVTEQADLIDEMYCNESLHNDNGKWQMIFGVDTHPNYCKKGLAAVVMNAFIDNARIEGRKRVVLTCKESLISYYEKFGFASEGKSESIRGNAIWYQMRLKF